MAINKSVRKALDFMGRTWEAKQQRDNRNLAIQMLFEEGFMLNPGTSPRYVSNKMLYQALWKLMQRTKILDFTIHGTGVPEWKEQAVTAGVSTVLQNGNGVNAFRSKNGMFFKMWLYGDAFLHMGTGENKSVPIQYGVVSNSNVYVDNYAVTMRNNGTGQSVTEMAIVMSYPKELAYKMYPELKRNQVSGTIDRGGENYKNELEQAYTQLREQGDELEVCHYYNIQEDIYCVFAGSQAYKLSELKGDAYPFKYNDESYIPVIHQYAFPSAQGFFNYGVGDILYDLALVTQRVINMGVHHGVQNIDPYTVISMPKGEGAEFFNRLTMADQQKAMGKRAWIPMEYDVTGAPNPVSITSLTSPGGVADLQLIMQMTDQQINRLGINLDEIAQQANVTATQILQEEETQQALVKQTMEYNASEIQNWINYTMDNMKTFIKTSNRTPLQVTTKINMDGQEVPISDVTLGMVSQELRDGTYFTKVNARTGAIPSNVFQQTQIQRAMAVTQGTPAYFPLLQQFLALNDRDVSLEQLQPTAQTPTMGDVETTATDTERLTIDATKERTPIA